MLIFIIGLLLVWPSVANAETSDKLILYETISVTPIHAQQQLSAITLAHARNQTSTAHLPITVVARSKRSPYPTRIPLTKSSDQSSTAHLPITEIDRSKRSPYPSGSFLTKSSDQSSISTKPPIIPAPKTLLLPNITAKRESIVVANLAGIRLAQDDNNTAKQESDLIKIDPQADIQQFEEISKEDTADEAPKPWEMILSASYKDETDSDSEDETFLLSLQTKYTKKKHTFGWDLDWDYETDQPKNSDKTVTENHQKTKLSYSYKWYPSLSPSSFYRLERYRVTNEELRDIGLGFIYHFADYLDFTVHLVNERGKKEVSANSGSGVRTVKTTDNSIVYQLTGEYNLSEAIYLSYSAEYRKRNANNEAIVRERELSYEASINYQITDAFFASFSVVADDLRSDDSSEDREYTIELGYIQSFATPEFLSWIDQDWW